ncbi:site-specific integrase [Streptomyces sp. NPDC006326]|uniref:site-specific integrase n=1 Tax=Streptomyces sp. NPDC006326 TaxID=3156752 RepID=UPI0033B517F5
MHWDDVHLDQAVFYVRCTLSAIDDNHLVITTPKTRSSRGWVAISPRVATALRHRTQTMPRTRGDPDDPFAGLVFCRPDGRPLGPQVLDRLRRLSAEAGVPRVTVHDLRHLAATITFTAGVPLTVVSKTLRHSNLSTTANLYSHLTQQAAREAVRSVAATTTRPHPPNPRSPPPTPLPRSTRLQRRGRPAPDRTCDHTATTHGPWTHERPPSHG